MTLKTPLAAAAALALLALAGCDRIGNPVDVLSVKRSSPDEFQVMTRDPLRMPRSASLPVPEPGAPSPLDPQPRRAAQIALLGTPAQPVAARASAGEQALLAAADASARDPEIRTVLETERTQSAEGPYEPPTLWELFGGGGGDSEVDPGDLVDPASESRRLQSEGVAAAPIDPEDRPAGAEPAPEPSQYPTSMGGRPQNKLPSSGTVPAF